VNLCRHGVAHHNVVDRQTGKPPDICDPKFFDPPLTTHGKMGAVEVGDAIQTWWHTTQAGKSIELIVTSPLTRCLQTAVLAFLPPLLGSSYNADHDQDESNDGAALPFLCVESVREAYGMHYPDRRRNKSLLQRHWPMVQFEFGSKNGNGSSATTTNATTTTSLAERDELWKSDRRESWGDVRDRVRTFLSSILCKRTEDNIVVVSHGVWIECCLEIGSPGILSADSKRVYNCDAFACKVVSDDYSGEFVRFDDVQQIYGGNNNNHRKKQDDG